MQDWFGGLKWFVELTRKDKVLALIAVLVIVIFVSCWVTYKVVLRSEQKDENSVAKADKRESDCDSSSAKKDVLIASLYSQLLEQAKENSRDLKEQRDKLQGIAGQQIEGKKEIEKTNKRSTRKLNTLSKEIEEAYEN